MGKKVGVDRTLRFEGPPELVLRFEMLPPMRALDLYTRLAHVMVPALGEAITPDTEIMVLVARVMATAKPEEIQSIARAVFSCCTAKLDGVTYEELDDSDIDTVFAQRTHEMIRAIVHGVRVNFSGFTGASASKPSAEATPSEPAEAAR